MKPDEIDLKDAFLPPISEDFANQEPPAEAPPNLLRAYWGAARAGFRRISYVSGPISTGLVVWGLAMMAFGVGAGRGWAIPTMLLNGLGFFLACGVWGGFCGVFFFMVGRVIPARIRTALSRATNRPIRLFPKVLGRFLSFWPLLVGLPIFLILATAFAAGIYAGRTVDHRLADAIAAADRDDPNWRLDDLMANREVVPDDENSAIVVARALERLPKSWPEDTPQTPGTLRPPPSEMMQASDRLHSLADNVRVDDLTAAILRDELAKRSEAVQIARTVADYRRGQHEIRIGRTVLDTPLRETQNARNVARLLGIDAAMRAQDGDIDGALDSCRATLGVGRSIGDEPFAISNLVRIAIGGVAMQSIQRVLAQGEPSDAALARLQALLLDELSQPTFLNSVKGERAATIEMFRRIADGELPISALSGNDSKSDPNAPRPIIGPWSKVWFDNQVAVGLEWMNDAVAIARLPIHERPARWKAWEDRIATAKRSRFAVYTSLLPMLLTPALTALSVSDSRHQTSLRAMAILLAAERHRRKTGEWPAAVAAIDPQILANPPVDPFSGKSFLIDRRDGQFFVHSIGPNGRDEHGAYEIRRWMNGGADDVGYSAWDVPRRKQVPRP